ncbi:hypothetical protein [uncultured Bacteroides sp.]|uniref:hypothetical protein n=1 Tax=uncultured Bacteroides sp. TaxID=162156 RepID=UPI00280C30AC|nr:hypothetical protein [uncultured Bacteroides sp.]
MFDGRNINLGMPKELVRMVNFLNEKESAGEFEFSDSVSYWENNKHIIESFSYDSRGWYFAVAFAYITYMKDGNIIFDETDNIRKWATGFRLVAGAFGWDPEFMKLNILSFEGKTENIGHLVDIAVQKYASSYYDNAVVLMSLLPQYKLSCFAGLMENDFNRYCVDYPPECDMEEFAIAFVRTNQLTNDDINTAFDITISHTSFISGPAMSFFLYTLDRLAGQRRETCEQKILELLQGDISLYVNPLCHWLSFQQKIGLFIEKCVILLIKGLKSENKEAALKCIDDSICIHLKDSNSLINIFITIAESLTPMDILTMNGCLSSLQKNGDDFLKFVLSFIIHPKGIYRVVGRRLWDDYHLEFSEFNPQKDLDEIPQCLFIISMLQDYGNPETRLPKLLPLIESDSTRVRNVIMNRLVPYLDDYMGHVIKVFDKLNINNEHVIKIRKYYDQRVDAIEKRRAIKELSPKYSYVVEYKEAMNTQKLYWQQQMKEAEKNNESFLNNIMTKVLLARGGGWRDDSGNIQHLGCIKISVPSRQLVQSMTPMEQNEWINELLKDWNETAGNN